LSGYGLRMMLSIVRRPARLLSSILAVAIAAGCSGGAALPPAAQTAAAPYGANPSRAPFAAGEGSKRRRVGVKMRIRIPRRKHARPRGIHPSTISPLTESVGISVNRGAQQLFDTTPTSAGCKVEAAGTTCTFTADAVVGTDTIVVTTYPGTKGQGYALDQGIATVPIVAAKANTVAMTLGPVVSSTNDTGEGSLRFAIASANAGDTIFFILPATATIVLASPLLISGSVSLAGPGVASGVTISGGGATQLFEIAGTATISGLVLTDGVATAAGNPGGAIVNMGSLTLANDLIGSSKSTAALKHAPRWRPPSRGRLGPHCSATAYEGGALYNDGSLTMSGNTFDSNVVPSVPGTCGVDGEGGAIFNDDLGTLSSTGDTFTNNSAMYGGAVYNAGVGQASFTNDTFGSNTTCTANSGCPTSCTSMTCTSFAQGGGAAILDAGSGVTIASSKFTNNVAGGATAGSTGQGGALFLAKGLPSVTNSTFTGNLAGGGASACSSGQGGAIAAAVPLVLDGDTFSSNVASGDSSSAGGAIQSTAELEGTNVTFTSNKATAAGSVCAPSATAIGGGAYTTTNATFSTSTFSDNAATGNAAGNAGALSGSNVVLNGDTFTGNSAVATGAASASTANAGAGAVSSSTQGKIGNCTFTNNSATIEGPNGQMVVGGAIVGAKLLTTNDNVFTSNKVSETAGTGTAAGGAIALASGDGSFSGDTFKSNTVIGTSLAGGGAAYFTGTFILNRATFTGNSAISPQALGGALISGTAGLLTGDTFTSNVANGSGGVGAGGAIYDSAGISLTGSTLVKNSATTTGGGLFTIASDSIVGSTISNNTVTAAATSPSGGGGIYANGSITLLNSTIANNSVTLTGAGQGGGGGIFNRNGLAMEDSTISGNKVLGVANSSGGGGIFSDAPAVVADSTIAGNTSAIDGGGIQIAANDSTTFTNVTIYENKATGIGGNIDNLFAMTLTNSIVAGGTAATGADIDNAGTLTSGDYNIIQSPVIGNQLTGSTSNDQAVDPKLLPLANNGGPTFTNADQLHGPGTAHIPFSGTMCGSAAVTVDQRGYARGFGGQCDVGAYEFFGTQAAIRHHALRAPVGHHATPSWLPRLPRVVLPKFPTLPGS
jgi:hypothetical protein